MEEWIHRYGLSCKDSATATHLSMCGGKYRVPHRLLDEFQRTYAAEAEAGKPLFLVERRSFPHFQPYFDIDIKVPAEIASVQGEMTKFCIATAAAITITMRKVCGTFDYTSICLMAPPMAEAGDMFKWGVHIVYPRVSIDLHNMIILVQKVTANEEFVAAVSPFCDPRTAIDVEVYKNATLRMPFSDKAIPCPICRKFEPARRMELNPIINRRIAGLEASAASAAAGCIQIPHLTPEENAAFDAVLRHSHSVVSRIREIGRKRMEDAIRECDEETGRADVCALDADVLLESSSASSAAAWRSAFIKSASAALCIPPAACAAALDGVAIMAGSAQSLVQRQIDSHAHLCFNERLQQMRPYRLGFFMDAFGKPMREATMRAAEQPLLVVKAACIRNIEVTAVIAVGVAPSPAEARLANAIVSNSFETRDPSAPKILVGGVSDANSDVLESDSSECCRIVSMIRMHAPFYSFAPQWVRRRRDTGAFVVATNPACPCARACQNLKNRAHHNSRIYFEVNRSGVAQKCMCRKLDVTDRVAGPCLGFATRIYTHDQADVAALFGPDANFQFCTDAQPGARAPKRGTAQAPAPQKRHRTAGAPPARAPPQAPAAAAADAP
jgi:hypothetical protein